MTSRDVIALGNKARRRFRGTILCWYTLDLYDFVSGRDKARFHLREAGFGWLSAMQLLEFTGQNHDAYMHCFGWQLMSGDAIDDALEE